MDVLFTLCVFFKPMVEINSSWGNLGVGWVLMLGARAVAEKAATAR